MHDFVHRTNLALETISRLPFVHKLEGMCKSLYSYFSASPKHHLEFTKLLEIVETEGLKVLKQVWTRWISLLEPSLEPLRCISSKYKTLIVKFTKDVAKESVAKKNLVILIDVTTLFSLLCIFPC